jgi:hypothetical protein
LSEVYLTASQAKRAERRHNAAVEQRGEDWRKLLSTEWGRRWFYQTITQADPYRTGRMDLFDAGRTDLARCLLAEARKASLKETLQMEQEAADALLEQRAKTKPPETEDEE